MMNVNDCCFFTLKSMGTLEAFNVSCVSKQVLFSILMYDVVLFTEISDSHSQKYFAAKK